MWGPAHYNWWPPHNNWWPPHDIWWPPVIIWWPKNYDWRILSENISPVSPASHHSFDEIESTTMMTSSNGNAFRVAGPLWGESIGHRWIPLTKTNDAELWCFSLICAWINGWANNREAGDLRRHRTHYEVTAMHLVDAFAFSERRARAVLWKRKKSARGWDINGIRITLRSFMNLSLITTGFHDVSSDLIDYGKCRLSISVKILKKIRSFSSNAEKFLDVAQINTRSSGNF